jgi:very-short-patch-repair endonuclease
MWVIYSLDPDTQLQAGDLRRDLIEFARAPDALDKLYEDKVVETESDFEEKVLRHLLNGGYRNVQPQYRVGAYRIDFVVKNGKKRIAIECDGDRFHGLDQLDADMSRQATLGRLGWKFVRIRGSEFYRDQTQAMDRVFRELTELGIPRNDTLNVEQEEAASSDLLERVKCRATQLLREWRGEDFQVDVHDLPDDRDATPVAVQPEKLVTVTTEVIEATQVDSPAEASNEAFALNQAPLTVERGLFDDETYRESRSETNATELDQFESARAIIHGVLEQRGTVDREELLSFCAPALTGRPLDKHSRSILNKTLFREIQAGRLKVDKAWTTVERIG